MTKKIVILLYLILFFLTPIIFSSQNSELFELPKMYFVYSATLLILIFHFYNYLRGWIPFFKHSFLDLPLLLFLGSQFISTIFSIDPHTSVFGYYSRLNGGLLSLICYALLYWILVIYIDDKFKNNIINISLTSGFLVALYGIAQHFGIDKNVWVQDVQARVFSTLGQPNWLAAYLCILIPFSIHKSLNSKNNYFAFIFYLLSFIFYLALLYTKSKSGIIAAIITLGLYFLPKLYSDFKNKVLFINHKSYIILLIFIVLSLSVPNPIKDFIFPMKISSMVNEPISLNITPSEDIRKIVWQGSIKLWQQFPFFGTGPETFAYSYYWTRPASHNLTSEWDFLYNKAHNEYINYLATTGTFGFLSYLILILIIIYQLLITNYHKKLVIFTSFLSILITNITGFSVVIVSLYFFLLPALLTISSPTKINTTKLPFKYLSIILIITSLFLLTKTFSYYLSDIAYTTADTLDNNQQYSQALSQIQFSLNRRPNEPVYQIKYANLLAKNAITAKKQDQNELSLKFTQQAISATDKATAISPFSINLWKEKAQIYYYLSVIDVNYYLKAIDALTKVTLLAPTDARSFYMLAEFYQNIKDTDNSVKYYQQAIALKPNYDHAYFALGKIYFDQKKYAQAQPLLESTLKYAPTNLDAQNYLALIATASSSLRGTK